MDKSSSADYSTLLPVLSYHYLPHSMSQLPSERNGGSPALTPSEAQEKLASIINEIAPRLTSAYCWKLIGAEPNSLATFLDVSEEDIISILRLCTIFGPNDTNVRLQKFELFANQLDLSFTDWSTYRAPGSTKAVPFIKIGINSNEDDETSILKPKDEYNGGVLVALPVSQQHKLTMKPRIARKHLGQLLSAVTTKKEINKDQNCSTDNNNKDSSAHYTHTSPSKRLLEFVVNSIETEVNSLSETPGSIKYHVTQRLERHLKKNLDMLVKDAASSLLKGALSRLADVVDDSETSKTESAISPEKKNIIIQCVGYAVNIQHSSCLKP